jgi:hypothetical protein
MLLLREIKQIRARYFSLIDAVVVGLLAVLPDCFHLVILLFFYPFSS